MSKNGEVVNEWMNGGGNMDEWLSVAQVQEEIGVPDNTIRRYIRNHNQFLNITKKHKSYLINKESLNTILRIREMYQDGMNTEQVNEALSTSQAITITVDEHGEQMVVDASQAFIELKKGMKESMNAMNETINSMSDEIRELKEEVSYQKNFIKETLTKRDEDLMAAIRQIQETKLLAAASKEKKWWEFWIK